ncbi:MAG: dienelactone hydrolase family protein [Roseiflexaceae bacterium]
MCYDDQAQPPIPPGGGGAIRSEELELTAADGNRFMAYVSLPEQAGKARMIVLPDIRGLHDFYKQLADRFAEIGIPAIAIDYFGRTAGISSRAEGFDFWPHVQQMTRPGILADIKAAREALDQHAGDGSVFMVGFCMGGMLSYISGMQDDLNLSGLIAFYAGLSRAFGGGQSLLESGNLVRTPSIGLFGGADQGIPVEQVEQFRGLLAQSGGEHRIKIYDGAPHSFFDRRYEEFAEASADAWNELLGFIRERA